MSVKTFHNYRFVVYVSMDILKKRNIDMLIPFPRLPNICLYNFLGEIHPINFNYQLFFHSTIIKWT